ALGVINAIRVRVALEHEVAQVLLLAARAAHVPAAPALVEWAGVIDAMRAGGKYRQSVPVGIHGANQITGQPLIGRGPMTDRAGVRLPGETRLIGGLLVQRVKHGPQGRVDRCHLHDITALAESDVHVVTKVDGTGPGGPDSMALET